MVDVLEEFCAMCPYQSKVQDRLTLFFCCSVCVLCADVIFQLNSSHLFIKHRTVRGCTTQSIPSYGVWYTVAVRELQYGYSPYSVPSLYQTVWYWLY